MLASIRNKTKGWVAYLIVGLIIVPFALFGINQYFSGEQNIVVASINGEDINKNEYLQVFNRQKRQVQERLGDRYNLNTEKSLQTNTINSLLDTKILENLTKKLNIATMEVEIKSDILNNPAFFEKGKFNLEQYQNILRLNGYTTSQYESLILKEKNNLQLRDNLLKSEFLTTIEEKLLNDLINEEREVAYVVINNKDFANEIKITDKQIADFYNKNSDKFQNPRKIKVDYVELSVDNLMKNISVDDKVLADTYADNKTRWTTDEERKASHILVADETTAKEVLAKIKQGEDFATLAKQYSDDKGSAKVGGDLGFFNKGVMVPSFEDAVFAMQVGEVSDLVKSDFGYHIIKLTAIKKPTIKPFAKVKDLVKEIYQENEAQKQLFDLTEKMQTTAYDGSLEDIVDNLDLKLKTTDFFTQNSTKFDKKFINASFSEEVLKNDENVVVEISSDKIVAMRKNTFVDSSKQTLQQAKASITQQLLTKEEAKLALKKAQTIIANKADNFSKSVFIGRDGGDADPEVANFAFTVGTKNLPIYKYKISADKSKVLVVKVSAIKTTGDKNDLSSIIESYNIEVFNDLLKDIKGKSEIKIFNNLL